MRLLLLSPVLPTTTPLNSKHECSRVKTIRKLNKTNIINIISEIFSFFFQCIQCIHVVFRTYTPRDATCDTASACRNLRQLTPPRC
jgi:hypothetical protein